MPHGQPQAQPCAPPDPGTGAGNAGLRCPLHGLPPPRAHTNTMNKKNKKKKSKKSKKNKRKEMESEKKKGKRRRKKTGKQGGILVPA